VVAVGRGGLMAGVAAALEGLPTALRIPVRYGAAPQHPTGEPEASAWSRPMAETRRPERRRISAASEGRP
jgi:hypothetical protein